MQTLSVRVPQSVNIEVIRAALASLGAQIVERVARKAKPAPEFIGMICKRRLVPDLDNMAQFMENHPDATRDERGWYEPFEIDGVEVAQRIRKMELRAAAALRRETPRNFAMLSCFKELSGPELTAAYVRDFCERNSLIKEATA